MNYKLLSTERREYKHPSYRVYVHSAQCMSLCSHTLESSESSQSGAVGQLLLPCCKGLHQEQSCWAGESDRAVRPPDAGTAPLCVPGWAQARPHLPGDGTCYPGRSCWGELGNCCSNSWNLFWLCPFRLKGKQKKARLTKGVGKDSSVFLSRLVFSGAHLCPAPWWAPELRKQRESGGQDWPLEFGRRKNSNFLWHALKMS